MTVFTVAIIGMNSIYMLVAFVLFAREYRMEKKEANEAHEHEKMVSKLAAQLHAEQQFSTGDANKENDGGAMIDAAAALLKFGSNKPSWNCW
jgi:hypothetical protein